ncbi:helicase-like protein [Actinoallomurus bryophytorum]|uniref:Helicase-like protein n=2 Tax=Actinoallomurus bryophytorum TaxID=1490222 RepID=A0A543BT44_9ACTN|nr:helicase-like protein [Actinoallomurus bryophytorum]
MRCAAVFEPADPPRDGRLAFWDPHGARPPAPHHGEPGEITVAVPRDGSITRVTVPALRMPPGAALPILLRARHTTAHPATAFWAAAALAALDLVARGRIRPLTSTDGHGVWHAGPLDAADLEHLAALAAALPPEARATPLPGTLDLPDPAGLVRAFLDAVADEMPRAPGRPPLGPPPAATRTEEGALRISLRAELIDPATGDLRLVVQVHRGAEIADAATLWAGDVHGFGPRARLEVTLAVRRAARAWPPLERLLRRPLPDTLSLTDEETSALLGDAARRLGAEGVQVHWPRELARNLTSMAVLGDRETLPGAHDSGLFDDDRLLSFDWRLTLGGEPLTGAEMDLLAGAHRPVVRLRDQWVLLDPELAHRARERTQKPITAIDALGAALAGTIEVDGTRVEVAARGRLAALRERIAEPAADPVRQPAELTAPLRDYQLRGLGWLARMTSLGLGGCLADQMGLGKTITLIALHLHRRAAAYGPTLVVCPTSLLGNWQREIERFAPGTPVRRFHGGHRELTDEGFVLTTYATMRLDAARLAAHRWGLLVADEAQHVKNPASGTARALRTIPAAARVALTGTPVENNLSELWAVLDWTTPGLLGTRTAFAARWAEPIEAGDTATPERLSRLIRPFLLRRLKSDPGIAPELPPKTETDRPVSLTREQAGLYEAAVRQTMTRIRAGTGMARRGLVMKLITALKQICNHPAHYLKETGSLLAGRSGKLDLLDELLDTIRTEDGTVLIFTQYVAMARLIEGHLTHRGLPATLLHGGTPVPRREEIVRRFQDGDIPVLLLSLRAAGTGLNLTRADHVIHYDRWWNPAVEDQATDRAHRIGQTRAVQVHRLIAEGTIEDRIAGMLRRKRDLAETVLGSGEAALSELSDDELADLVALREDPR